MRAKRFVIPATFVIVLSAAVALIGNSPPIIGDAPTAHANEPISDVTTGGGDGGGGGGEEKPPKKSTYCKYEPDFPNVRSDNQGYYKYNDGSRSYTYNVGDFSVQVANREIQGQTEGAYPTHVEFKVWCTDGEGKEERNVKFIWVPLATADAVADQYDLLAKVVAQLPDPVVKFVDSEINDDGERLYVKVEHHLTIDEPGPETATQSAGNDWLGYITAWIEANPYAVHVKVLDDAAGEAYAEECNYAQAISSAGCPIKFDHSSSIAADGVFEVEVRLWWKVRSNSGKYDGKGPFETKTIVKIPVAEAMAVGK